MITSWKDLPTGNPQEVKGVVAAEWRAYDPETQSRIVQQFKDRFCRELREQSITGLINYCCFLNEDGQHIFHFSEWSDETALKDFVHHRDHLFSATQFGQKLTSLWKNAYYLYRSNRENGKLIWDTGFVVFEKQYFKEQGQAKHWVDMILETLLKEGQHEGLIQKTYYLNINQTGLLNFALWENEESYNRFLQHPFARTINDWQKILNYKGWLPEKGVVRRHDRFLSIYQSETKAHTN